MLKTPDKSVASQDGKVVSRAAAGKKNIGFTTEIIHTLVRLIIPDRPQSAHDTISSGSLDFLFILASPKQKSQ